MDAAGVFVAHPWLALLPSAGFAGLAARRRRAAPLLAAAAWLVYAVYEGAMARRLLCSGECNIRVDLLMLYPALLMISVVALMVGRRARPANA